MHGLVVSPVHVVDRLDSSEGDACNENSGGGLITKLTQLRHESDHSLNMAIWRSTDFPGASGRGREWGFRMV